MPHRSNLAWTAALAAASLWVGQAHAVDPYKPPKLSPSPSSVAPLRNPIPNVSACRARCATSCQQIGCSGLNESQCLTLRQRCRLSCSPGC